MRSPNLVQAICYPDRTIHFLSNHKGEQFCNFKVEAIRPVNFQEADKAVQETLVDRIRRLAPSLPALRLGFPPMLVGSSN